MSLLFIYYIYFKSLNDGLYITDIDECINGDNCKGPGKKCLNILGNFTCSCIEGYRWDRSAGVDLCVINQPSLQVKLFVGKYT